ncbi:MAG TPA: gas vesicle protein GvpG [Candidatus Limnocylindria bacterium]
MFGLGKLLIAPLWLPAAGIRYCLEKVAEVADRELYDEGPVKEELLLLSLRYDDGEIDEAEFHRGEAALIARLSEIRAARRESAAAEPADAEPGFDFEGSRSVVIEQPEELQRQE